MASKKSQSRPVNVDANPSPDTFYHVPVSPSEAGKFDFYRVHLANHVQRTNPTVSESSDVPSLSSGSSSSIPPRRWTPFADIVGSDLSKSSSFTSNSSINSLTTSKASSSSSSSSSTASESNGSFSWSDFVKSAMQRGHAQSTSNAAPRPQVCGTTISSKDLNHLCPQSA